MRTLRLTPSQATGLALAADPDVVGPEFAAGPRRTEVSFASPEHMPRKGEQVHIKVGEHGIATARVVRLVAVVEFED